MKSSGEAQSKKDLDSLPLRHIAAKYLRQIPSQATLWISGQPSPVSVSLTCDGVRVAPGSPRVKLILTNETGGLHVPSSLRQFAEGTERWLRCTGRGNRNRRESSNAFSR